MLELYHDRARQILLYKTDRADFVEQHIPGSRKVNGSHVAVPATLRNMQLLRRIQYPIPGIMEASGYDWPIQRGRKPLAHQKLMAEFMVAHPKCFNLSDMGCVSGETLIDTAEGRIPIEELARKGRRIGVRCLTDAGPRYVGIDAPFQKGYAPLYRVTFDSGRQIIVTARHVFLTCRGWTSCEQLQIGEQLPIFDAYPPQSTWAPCHVKFRPDVHRLWETVSGSSGYSDSLFCDARLLPALDIDLNEFPSLAGAPERIPLAWHRDGLGTIHTRTDQPYADPRSKRRCGVRHDRGEMGDFLSVFATKLTCNQFHISAQYHLSPSRQRAIHEDQELRLCIPLDTATKPPFDTVTHIAYDRYDAYYDMEVPSHANYVAHGLCNHNTMKTLSTLWAADFIMQKEGSRALIVAPLSILQRVWQDAIFANFLGRRNCVVVHGSGRERQELLRLPADFYIVNFDGLGVGATTRKRFELGGLSQDIFERSDIRLAIIDEASAYRDARTKRHRVARVLLGQRDYLWLLTGTPTPNDPTDAYGLARLAGTHRGETFTSYHNRVMLRVSQFKWVPRAGSYDEARKLLQPAIRFDIRDVWDGPPMTTQQREVELTAEQKKAMAELKRSLVVTMQSGQQITMANEAAARQKFMQISLGAVYDESHQAHKVDAGTRLTVLKEIIDNAPGKILCFVPLTSVINMLYRELKGRLGCAIVNGETPTGERERIFASFQRLDADESKHSSCQMLIADPGTMAHGLDLYAARTVVWYGPTDRTELYLQANRRAHRPGQKHPVTVVQIVSNPLEREIFRRLETNESLQGVLLQMVREGKV